MARSANAGRTNQVRIIGGRWRSRKVSFPDGAGLRPTPDRVRETLFNWLQFDIAGRRCLDLFAGSGVLGLEALSRGAGQLTVVDASRAALQAINENLAALDAEDVQVIDSDALSFLTRAPAETFDIVFLDPPYDSDLLPRACGLLEQHNWLSNHARIYLETEAGRDDPADYAPDSWTQLRSARAGQVVYSLYEKG